MGTPANSRRRILSREMSEDETMMMMIKEADAKSNARQASFAEAKEACVKKLVRQQQEDTQEDFEEKYMDAVQSISQLETEKTLLVYEVEQLRDVLEGTEEELAELHRKHTEISRELKTEKVAKHLLQQKINCMEEWLEEKKKSEDTEIAATENMDKDIRSNVRYRGYSDAKKIEFKSEDGGKHSVEKLLGSAANLADVEQKHSANGSFETESNRQQKRKTNDDIVNGKHQEGRVNGFTQQGANDTQLEESTGLIKDSENVTVIEKMNNIHCYETERDKSNKVVEELMEGSRSKALEQLELGSDDKDTEYNKPKYKETKGHEEKKQKELMLELSKVASKEIVHKREMNEKKSEGDEAGAREETFNEESLSNTVEEGVRKQVEGEKKIMMEMCGGKNLEMVKEKSVEVCGSMTEVLKQVGLIQDHRVTLGESRWEGTKEKNRAIEQGHSEEIKYGESDFNELRKRNQDGKKILEQGENQEEEQGGNVLNQNKPKGDGREDSVNELTNREQLEKIPGETNECRYPENSEKKSVCKKEEQRKFEGIELVSNERVEETRREYREDESRTAKEIDMWPAKRDGEEIQEKDKILVINTIQTVTSEISYKNMEMDSMAEEMESGGEDLVDGIERAQDKWPERRGEVIKQFQCMKETVSNPVNDGDSVNLKRDVWLDKNEQHEGMHGREVFEDEEQFNEAQSQRDEEQLENENPGKNQEMDRRLQGSIDEVKEEDSRTREQDETIQHELREAENAKDKVDAREDLLQGDNKEKDREGNETNVELDMKGQKIVMDGQVQIEGKETQNESGTEQSNGGKGALEMFEQLIKKIMTRQKSFAESEGKVNREDHVDGYRGETGGEREVEIKEQNKEYVFANQRQSVGEEKKGIESTGGRTEEEENDELSRKGLVEGTLELTLPEGSKAATEHIEEAEGTVDDISDEEMHDAAENITSEPKTDTPAQERKPNTEEGPEDTTTNDDVESRENLNTRESTKRHLRHRETCQVS
ncbi:golgin subfamily A member 6-like protein 25 [Heptranchias perlo]|uniref:golgin subfamily A member 6-like protein 25 n=1 Tax=Heptranchias perlo TaxID=212740 RepID=UPI00355A34F2